MNSSLLYQDEMFVVLETEQPEVFLTADELRDKLQTLLEYLAKEDLPRPLQKFATPAEQAIYLRDNFCELNQDSDRYLQWYAVRLEK